jgi:amidohydrolase
MTINICPEINEISEDIIFTRRDFHKYPELAFQEHRSAKIIAEKLTSFGLNVETGVGKTGVVGILNPNHSGKTIALRADMDALPIQETGDVEYASQNDGIMHACGHDGHMAILLGVAKVLSEKSDTINGTIKFIFQPAEEGYGGAKYMIKDGVLNGVDEIYGAHLWNYQKYGTIGVKPGPVMAAADLFTITIKGKGGHGATPHGTVDAVVVSSHVIQALQTIVSRNTNPLESTVVTIGKINGGYNFNIIADNVVLKGTARAYTEENRQLIKTRMNEILKGLSAAFNAKISLDYEDGYPPTINDKTCAENLLNSATKIVGAGAGEPYLSMGGEDFSYFANEKPGCFFFIGSSPNDRELLSTPHHCSHFDIDEEALLVGSSVFVQLIEDLLIT